MNGHESKHSGINAHRMPLKPREHGNLLVNLAEPPGEESVLSMADADPETWVTVTAKVMRMGEEPMDGLHLAELMGDDERLGFVLVPVSSGRPPVGRPISFQGQIQDVPIFLRVIEVTAWREVDS